MFAAQVVRAERGLPAAARRNARRVERIGTRAHVVIARGVAHRAGEIAEHDRARAEVRVRPARDAAVRSLHAEQSGVAGGDADRTAAVTAGRERDEPTCDRSRAPARRTADGTTV